ncbi:MAG: hypothetical protein ACI8Y7_001016 [Candidatus Woesearchaeota archaeon]|jgi:hypothetical protein
MISQKQLNTLSAKTKQQFVKRCGKIRYELKGMFNSELLAVAALIDTHNVDCIIESVRARGHSTEVIASYFSKIPIHSVDYDKNQKGVVYSEKRLKHFSNLRFHYGDSFDVVPRILRRVKAKSVAVVIDGPKGEDAILLALQLATFKQVKIIFIHDLAQSEFERYIAESIFEGSLYTDHVDFVKQFQSLDDDCWSMMKAHQSKPYVRGGIKTPSYGPTMGIIFPNSVNAFAAQSYIAFYKKSHNMTIKYLLLQFSKKIPFLYKTLLGIRAFFHKLF